MLFLIVAALGAVTSLSPGAGKPAPGETAGGRLSPPSPSRPSPPSVVLITLDTTRADALGCYGAAANPTPHLDRLAARGVRFESALASCPLTLPSHATLLTGLYPPEHGLRDNSPRALSPAVPLVTEAFASAGYHTAAFVSAETVARKWGLARGFALYNDGLGPRLSPLVPRERIGGETVAVAVRWLRAVLRTKKPFFLWVHLFDPHDPYRAPPPFRKRFPGDPYLAEVAYADDCLGRLLAPLEAAGRLGATAVIVAGDHGEGRGEHGEETHAHLVHGSTIHVPLLFCFPERWPGGRAIAEPVSLADVAPTLYHLLDVRPPRVSGVSLLRVLEGDRNRAARRPLYVESLYDFLHFGWAPLRAVRLGPHYLIEADDHHQLYDLHQDPGEQTNRAADDPDILRELRIELARLVGTFRAPDPGRTGRLNAPPGYLQAPHAAPTLKKDAARRGKRRIPMEAIGDTVVFERIKNASMKRRLPALRAARDRLGRLLEGDADNPSYLFWAGRIHRALALRLRDLGREPGAVLSELEQARAFFLKTLNRRPDHVGAQNLLFYCLIVMNDPEPVIRGARTVLEEGYENRDTRLWLAAAYLTRKAPGDLDRADRTNREGLKRFPDSDRLAAQRREIDRLLLQRKLEPRRRP